MTNQTFKILIVEDNPKMASMLQIIFAEELHHPSKLIFIAPTPEKALELMEGHEFSLIMCDKDLPPSKKTGPAFVQDVRENQNLSQPTIIGMSGDLDRREIPQLTKIFMDAGADGFVYKPPTLNDLEAIYARVIEEQPEEEHSESQPSEQLNGLCCTV